MSKFKAVTHVIFDMDGLLINTEDLYTELFNDICAEFGKTYTYELKLKLMGRKPKDAIEIMMKELEIDGASAQEILDLSHSKQPKYFCKTKLLPGAAKLINHLAEHDIPMSICTGSSKEAFAIKTDGKEDMLALFGKMKHILKCGSDERVKRGKPEPDAYLVAKSLFTPEPKSEDCLAFEDSPGGVESAVNAGMQCIMVPDPRVPAELRAKATTVYGSLEDFKPEDFGLPAY